MAELALSAFAALATGGAGAGLGAAGTAAAVSSATAAGASGLAAAGWAAGTTVTAAGAASGALSTLSTVATVASMASTLIGGYGAFRQSESQAAMAELNASAARLEAEEKAVRIRREYVQKVGAARVAFAGSGLDISSGAAIEGGYAAEKDFETALARSGGEIAAAGYGMDAASARSRGRMSLVQAAARSAGAFGQDRISIARRG